MTNIIFSLKKLVYFFYSWFCRYKGVLRIALRWQMQAWFWLCSKIKGFCGDGGLKKWRSKFFIKRKESVILVFIEQAHLHLYPYSLSSASAVRGKGDGETCRVMPHEVAGANLVLCVMSDFFVEVDKVFLKRLGYRLNQVKAIVTWYGLQKDGGEVHELVVRLPISVYGVHLYSSLSSDDAAACQVRTIFVGGQQSLLQAFDENYQRWLVQQMNQSLTQDISAYQWIHDVQRSRGLLAVNTEEQVQGSYRGLFLLSRSPSQSIWSRVVMDITQEVGDKEQKKVLRKGLMVGACLLLVGFYGHGVMTLYRNHQLLKETRQLLDAQYGVQLNPMQQLNGVAAMMPLVKQLSSQSPNWLSFLSYNLQFSVQQLLQQQTMAQLRTYFAKPMVTVLQNELKQQQQQWATLTIQEKSHREYRYYQLLNDYLAFYYQSYQFLPGTISDLTHKFDQHWWQQGGDMTMEDAADHQQWVRYYLHHAGDAKVLPLLDMSLVKTAREQLGQTNFVDSVYAQFRQQALSQYPEKAIMNWLPALQGFKGELSFIYSQELWQKTIKQQLQQLALTTSKGNWVRHPESFVLPDSATAISKKEKAKRFAHMFNQFKDRYIQDTLNHWLQLFNDLQFTTGSSLSQWLSQLSQFNQQQLLKALLKLLYDNTHYLGTQTKNHSLQLKIKEINRVHSPMGLNMLTHYRQTLDKLVAELTSLLAGNEPQQQALNYVRRILQNQDSTTVLYQAHVAANLLLIQFKDPQIKQAYATLFNKWLVVTWRYLLVLANEALQQQWKTLYDNYQQKIAAYYPFKKHGPPLDPSQLIRFFQPVTGTYGQFMRQTLRGLMYQKSSHWQANQWLGLGLSLTSKQKKLLQQLSQLSQLLFHHNSQQIQLPLSFAFQPSPKNAMVRLTMDNKIYRYYNGPQHWQNYLWQPNSQSSQISLEVLDINNQIIGHLQTQGPWAIIKLLRQTKTNPYHHGTCQLTWHLTHTTVTIKGNKTLCRLAVN